jgi:heterodisulfide reductase subunit B
LLVENENMILNTIKSRCTKISFTDEEEKNFTEEQEELYNKLDKILSNVKNYSLLDALNDLEFIYKSDKNINEILEYINMIFYKNIKKNVENIYYIDIVEETKNRLKLNANYNMTIDNMIFSIFKYI